MPGVAGLKHPAVGRPAVWRLDDSGLAAFTEKLDASQASRCPSAASKGHYSSFRCPPPGWGRRMSSPRRRGWASLDPAVWAAKKTTEPNRLGANIETKKTETNQADWSCFWTNHLYQNPTKRSVWTNPSG